MKRTAHAIALTDDWNLITSSLTTNRIDQIAEELSQAIARGVNSRKAADIHSQFWFGAMLARAGLHPAVPLTKARRPDFVVSADTVLIAIEVKRPSNRNAALRSLKEAASQIRDYGRPGFIAVDLSMALGVDRFVTDVYHDNRLPSDALRPIFRAMAQELSDRVGGYRQKGKWSGILGLFTFARLIAWHSSAPGSPERTLYIHAPIFEDACSGLIVDTARRVKTLLKHGTGAMSNSPLIAFD